MPLSSKFQGGKKEAKKMGKKRKEEKRKRKREEKRKNRRVSCVSELEPVPKHDADPVPCKQSHSKHPKEGKEKVDDDEQSEKNRKIMKYADEGARTTVPKHKVSPFLLSRGKKMLSMANRREVISHG